MFCLRCNNEIVSHEALEDTLKDLSLCVNCYVSTSLKNVTAKLNQAKRSKPAHIAKVCRYETCRGFIIYELQRTSDPTSINCQPIEPIHESLAKQRDGYLQLLSEWRNKNLPIISDREGTKYNINELIEC